MLRALSVSFLLLASACSPVLREAVVDHHAYAFSAPCGQGPFVLTVPLKGARWREGFALHGFVRRPVVGHYTVKLAGKEIASGPFASRKLVQSGSVTLWLPSDKPGNERCVERPAPPPPEPAAAPVAAPQPIAAPPPPAYPAPSAPVYPVAPQPVYMGPPPPGWRPIVLEAPAPAPTPPPQPAPQPALPPPPVDTTPARLVALDGEVFLPDGDRNLDVVSFFWDAVDEIGTSPLPPDATLEITLWSEQPNDWEGATLQVVQTASMPNVPEAEYIAWLHAERAKAEAEAKARKEEADKAWAKRVAFCNAHLDDEDCWGTGGYEARLNPPPKQKPPVVKAVPVAQPAAPQAPQPNPPQGPPPAAQLETPPPQPSDHAAWVAGYWQWTGFSWQWLPGWWKVPEADLVAQATLTAPVAPPPVRVEMMPPPPMPMAVWLAGAWYWDGRAWFWQPGQWTLPPSVGLQWQAPVWVSHATGVRLIPGTWRASVQLP